MLRIKTAQAEACATETRLTCSPASCVYARGPHWHGSCEKCRFMEVCLSLERLDRKDARVLLLWILAGLVGAGVAYRYFFQAFPEASVEFKVPRAESLERAKQFASAQGARLE